MDTFQSAVNIFMICNIQYLVPTGLQQYLYWSFSLATDPFHINDSGIDTIFLLALLKWATRPASPGHPGGGVRLIIANY